MGTMNDQPMITVDIPGHGVYSAPAWVVDLVRSNWTTPLVLDPVRDVRVLIERRTDGSEDWKDVSELAALLVVLADFEHAAMLVEAEAKPTPNLGHRS